MKDTFDFLLVKSVVRKALLWYLLLVFILPFLFVVGRSIVNQFQEPTIWGKGPSKDGSFICEYGGFRSIYHEDYCSVDEWIHDIGATYLLFYVFFIGFVLGEIIPSDLLTLLIPTLFTYSVIFLVIYIKKRKRKNVLKHIHFIGICGVAMSALAIALHKKGYKVTGSDKGFYPPISTHLKNVGIPYYAGWHPEKMIEHGVPDLVVVGNVAGSSNPEWQYIEKQNIPYKSYPEVVKEFFVKEKSIVCAGTYGKSTSTTLLSWLFKSSGMEPSYMVGVLPLNEMDAAEIGDGEWSILEGDEYKASRWDTKAKFFHYAPTHLLLTSVVWDHADVYPTEASYRDAFQSLVHMLPHDGLLVLSEQAQSQIDTSGVRAKIVTYGKKDGNEYQYTNITQSKDGISFDILHDGKSYHMTSPLLGEYMADNITGCFALAHSIGIPEKHILSALHSFSGMKRRLEKRATSPVTVFDDIAHSPTKARSTLATLRSVYTGRIFAVFEPNTGNRQKEAIPAYADAFRDADTVIIPRLTKIKVDPSDPDEALDGDTLTAVIGKTHSNVRYISDDEQLVTFLVQESKPGDVIVFLGSHGFRNMIERVTDQLKQK
ncbi:MAG TPA: Mur ligase domain-containing protein [Candidatus Kapabacteria bacterium]|nr:Mur ligase domain-containing protein [Candidatus Kapabacteria bacterium]